MHNNSFMLNILPISLGAIFVLAIITLVLAPSKKIPQEVTQMVESFAVGKQNLDFKRLQRIYAANAIVEFDYIYPDGTPQKSYQANALHFLDIRRKTRAESLKLKDYNTYQDIKYEWMGEDVMVTSVRYNHLTKRRTPHTLIITPSRKTLINLSGKKKHWFITKEYIMEYAATN